MCLAVPMQVVDIKKTKESLTTTPVAIVRSGGVVTETRLDIVDRMPSVGDYVIVHAGFAIHTLSSEEAETNIALMQEMANLVTPVTRQDETP